MSKELDDNNEWNKEYYYESRTVNKGRIDKTCDYCDKTIPKGQKHEVHKLCCDEYIDCPTHLMNPDHGDALPPGEKSCSELFVASLK